MLFLGLYLPTTLSLDNISSSTPVSLLVSMPISAQNSITSSCGNTRDTSPNPSLTENRFFYFLTSDFDPQTEQTTNTVETLAVRPHFWQK